MDFCPCIEIQQDLYKDKLQYKTLDKSIRTKATKVYCGRCDLIFETREKFENHLGTHYSKVVCEVCPIDTAIAKFLNLFRRKSHGNLE